MRTMPTSALDVARRFLGTREVSGQVANPAILAMLRLDAGWPSDDAVPWCSAFVNYVAWILDLPRSRSLSARSWLDVGAPVELEQAAPGFDVVVLKRGGADQPGPEVLAAPGHVGFYEGSYEAGGEMMVQVVGGNQGNSVSRVSFPVSRVLGVRRLA